MKNGKLDLNSPLFRFIDETSHLIALNLVFVISCIPILTIGPAVAALYQVLMREARGEHSYLVRKYWQHMKEMLRQGISIFLFYVVAILVLSFSCVFWFYSDSAIATCIAVLLLIALCIVITSMLYVFPIMARFENTFIRTIKNAFFMALSNLKYSTLLLLLHIVVIGLLYLFPVTGAFMVIIGFTMFTYGCAYLFQKIFRPYEATASLNSDISYTQ